MNRPKSPRAKDFQWKIWMVMYALDKPEHGKLCDLLFPTAQFSAEQRETWLDKLRRYSQGRDTTTNEDLYSRIRDHLKVEIPNTAFKNAAALDFYNRLTPHHQERINDSGDEKLLAVLFPEEHAGPFQLLSNERTKEPTIEPNRGTQRTRIARGQQFRSSTLLRAFRLVHVSPAYRHPDIDQAIHEGEFHHTYLYLDPNASVRWHELTSVPSRYPTFKSCLDSLGDLIASDQWKAILHQQPIAHIVVFGAGAAKKDLALLDHLAQNPKHRKSKVTYILVDTSFHMLFATAEEMLRLKGKDYEQFLKPVALVGDFMNLDDIKKCLDHHKIAIRSPGGRTLFWIPGNTIANVDATRLVHNLRANTHQGDLFLVGAEFADTKNLATYTNTLISHYNHDLLKQLVLPPLRSYFDRRKRSITYRKLARLISPIPNRRYDDQSESLIDKVTVDIVASVGRKKIVLASSSRYDKGDFLKFLSANKFRPALSIPDTHDPHFEQVLSVRE